MCVCRSRAVQVFGRTTGCCRAGWRSRAGAEIPRYTDPQLEPVIAVIKCFRRLFPTAPPATPSYVTREHAAAQHRICRVLHSYAQYHAQRGGASSPIGIFALSCPSLRRVVQFSLAFDWRAAVDGLSDPKYFNLPHGLSEVRRRHQEVAPNACWTGIKSLDGQVFMLPLQPHDIKGKGVFRRN